MYFEGKGSKNSVFLNVQLLTHEEVDMHLKLSNKDVALETDLSGARDKMMNYCQSFISINVAHLDNAINLIKENKTSLAIEVLNEQFGHYSTFPDADKRQSIRKEFGMDSLSFINIILTNLNKFSIKIYELRDDAVNCLKKGDSDESLLILNGIKEQMNYH